MKKTMFVSIVAIACLFTACMPQAGLRFTYVEIESFPQAIRKSIKKKEAVLGMTPVQVRYALGSPRVARTFSSEKEEILEEWTYRSVVTMKKVYVIFQDGQVVKIETEQRMFPSIRIEKIGDAEQRSP